MIVCDNCGADSDTNHIGYYLLTLQAPQDEDQDKTLESRSLHLCDGCKPKVLTLSLLALKKNWREAPPLETTNIKEILIK